MRGITRSPKTVDSLIADEMLFELLDNGGMRISSKYSTIAYSLGQETAEKLKEWLGREE